MTNPDPPTHPHRDQPAGPPAEMPPPPTADAAQPAPVLPAPPTTPARTVGRWALAGVLVFAGLSHLFWGRETFRAQVPKSVPMDEDGVVMASGGVEIMLGAGLALLRSLVFFVSLLSPSLLWLFCLFLFVLVVVLFVAVASFFFGLSPV